MLHEVLTTKMKKLTAERTARKEKRELLEQQLLELQQLDRVGDVQQAMVIDLIRDLAKSGAFQGAEVAATNEPVSVVNGQPA